MVSQQQQQPQQQQQQGPPMQGGQVPPNSTQIMQQQQMQQQQMQQQQPAPNPQQQQTQQQQLQPRFEDLTIDDDLPLLPRLQRYVQSSIALQRLVHVRMLGEVALQIGQQLTATELVPLLPPLVKDGESIIRQRLCEELKVLCLVLMGMALGKDVQRDPLERDEGNDAENIGEFDDKNDPNNENSYHNHKNKNSTSKLKSVMPQIPKPNKHSKYYKVMVHHLFPHLYTLISDPDNEVRRAASETIVKLALRMDEDDVVSLALSIPLRLVKEGQARQTGGKIDAKKGDAQHNNPNNPNVANSNGNTNNTNNNNPHPNPQTPAEDLLITASNLLADLSSFLPPTRLPPNTTSHYLSPTLLSLAEDANFRVRRAAVQALPRMLGSAALEDVKRRLLPKFVGLSGDEMYRVRKASGECLVDVSRGLTVLPYRVHFDHVWISVKEEGSGGVDQQKFFYKPRTKKQINELHNTIAECHEIRRRALCAIARSLLDDSNKFVRYGMMQFLGPLIASFYPLDRGSMVGGMGGLLFGLDGEGKEARSSRRKSSSSSIPSMGVLGIGVGSVGIAKSATGLDRFSMEGRKIDTFGCGGGSIEEILSFNHSLHGLELILHGECPLNHTILKLGAGDNANKLPFGTMGPQFFPHANGMVGRSSALDDDDTDALLLSANLGKSGQSPPPSSPKALLPKFILESRSDALALSRIVWHRTGRIPSNNASSTNLPYPPLMMGRPDPEDLKAIRSSLLNPFLAMASCRTGEETTDAEMRVYCAYSLPAVILLFGGMNWEMDGLKTCFLELIGRDGLNDDDDDDEDEDDDRPPPPLPVKRCLASSVHAVAHMLGPEIVSKDTAFLASFERAFLRDPDEAIRLNVLKNLASFLGALPPGDGAGHRNYYLPLLHSIITGEDVLGASKKRSASNPGVLNWRQRDAVARVLPDLILLFNAKLTREFIWPILKMLLTDSVSAVREDAGWSVPVLLRKYTKSHSEKEARAWMSEVIVWLKETFLDEGNGDGKVLKRSFSKSRRHKKMVASEGAFSKRQGYCRIVAAVALSMRMGEDEDSNLGYDHSDSEEDESGHNHGMPALPIDPFGKMSQAEMNRFRSILLNDLLPAALDMTVDCVANVRLTLTKCLKLLPADIRAESQVEEVLSTLEEELMTWDVGDMALNDVQLGMLGGTGANGGMGAMDSSMGPADPPGTQQMDGNVLPNSLSAC
mmetsp:Transcript_25449/g.53264  ORF Transcript_25449/g.53264 Transcript_25449/m.53264 type:complete len:1204 (+) Transcript_25449:255-3866(+)